MSEAPRVQLTSTDLSDLDPSAPSNQYSSDPYSNQYSSNQRSARQNGDVDQYASNAAQNAQQAGSSILASAQNAMNAAASHPAVQNTKETVLNGPVAQNVKAEGARTRDEFADLANSRTIPEHKTATGQNLTHYHSMFYRLLSWKNPRATGIAFGVTVMFIFAARYLNVIHYILKGLYITLGATASAELVGQLAIGRGLTTQIRPQQYFTIPKASLERLLDDVEQLINFFVIESQRIVFAENVYATLAAFVASLTSYFLIKFVPLWGLALIATLVTYLGPLVYIKNKAVIDAQLEKGYNIASQQAVQLKEVASKNAVNAAHSVQGITNQYTAKATETINQYRGGRPTSPEAKRTDFPVAPKHEPLASQSQYESNMPAAQPIAQPVL
ncbi:hypothetical protein P153DRAFT_366137 [Dothidotthia symphoricarpi CBS 119687]|uniref:Reticulon-like protein n=1 Tax=Dothidotthia symphoricarpi CBS 119687 TaxID=1392245 RepID=A0A6A6AH43_9PLEO|nr:uncharacterized protein P153DRAFT_366137 [Dothidotthia symphoricarpi CBS 119687]KAF2130563.1 hypothetical protein P153DRAFT_366137 [Dothidotthia symphoricarpi CBS 119687]